MVRRRALRATAICPAEGGKASNKGIFDTHLESKRVRRHVRTQILSIPKR